MESVYKSSFALEYPAVDWVEERKEVGTDFKTEVEVFLKWPSFYRQYSPEMCQEWHQYLLDKP